MTIYVDNKHRCHAYPADGRTPYDIQFFDGKAPGAVECYEYYPATAGKPEQIRAVKPTDAIDASQRQYEIDEAVRWTSMNVPQEQGFTAKQNHVEGDFFAVQGQLYKCIYPIPATCTIVPGSNAAPATMEEYLESIKEG